MCGICGVGFVTRKNDVETRVRAMTAALHYRGPDDEGFLTDSRAPGLSLRMRRLSIIDLEGGRQPIWNESRDVAAFLNGEIYNYREVRKVLERLGHRFTTKSDTEVLVHAWEEWGEECLSEFRGMFALAIVDLRKHYTLGPVLFLARDPLGIKPLYYTQTNEAFAFASEVRALLASGIPPKSLSRDALTSFLLFGSVSEPVTLLEGVFSLPPGHRMLLYVPDRRRMPRPHPWWDPKRSSAARDSRKPRDFGAAAKQLRPLLQDAVRSHLVADVPVGVFLSSGLDSGAIASLAAREHPHIQSFTVSFPGTSLDESELTRVVAQRCGTQHTELPLDGPAIVSRMDEALAALDQPTMDGVNTFFVSWAARQLGMKVALSGLGGDELFAGYPTFSDTFGLEVLARLARLAPGFFRSLTAPLLTRLLSVRRSADAGAKAVSAWKNPSGLPHPYYFARLLFPPDQIRRFTDPRFRPSTVSADGTTLEPTWLGWLQRTADEASHMEPVAAVAWLEMRNYMVSTLLRDTDSVSMANSLEVRVPLLDTPMVEFVCALPDGARRRPGVQKALLVSALDGILPAEILRQRKRTFTLPWEEWLRGPLRPKLENSFGDLSPALAPYWKTKSLQWVWTAFLEGKTTWSRPWSLFVLNEWCRRLG